MPKETLGAQLAELIRSQHPTAPRFFPTWKQAAQLAGISYFGDGSRSGFEQAQSKWDLCPNLSLIRHAIGVMSHGEQIFLAALVSVYDAEDGGALLQQSCVQGLADFGGLDLERRTLLANLILSYDGW
ncbi:hypothetical protein PF66_01361 [Pseudomonas asplenii]|uniref:Uncharacterized protein n=1 Tax=Pseudomonas asplenii TaxID=53407 RepID=A0A0N0VK32_9PSED|nr:hypothetical protein [Pseudomonas fuscovaginae]KPA91780.1 hypothetical protein PF66_01361 [Pseudomonas fuscovaginae]